MEDYIMKTKLSSVTLTDKPQNKQRNEQNETLQTKSIQDRGATASMDHG